MDIFNKFKYINYKIQFNIKNIEIIRLKIIIVNKNILTYKVYHIKKVL